MDKLIYNTLNGNYQSLDSVPVALRELVSASPFFIVDDKGNIRLSSNALGLLTYHLYSMESMVQIIRQSVTVDTSELIAQSLQINDRMNDIKIADAVVKTLDRMGVNRELILQFVDNTIERITPEAAIQREQGPESYTEAPLAASSIHIADSSSIKKERQITEKNVDEWDLYLNK